MSRSYLQKFFRPGFYAGLLIMGQIVAYDQLIAGNEQNFVAITIVVSMIMLAEIYSNWTSRFTGKDDQFKLQVVDRYGLIVHWIHHIILPILTYYSATLFIYFNRSGDTLLSLSIFNFFVYMVLFFNLRSFFERDVVDEKVSHYIYDILKLYIFFTSSNVIYQIAPVDIRTFLSPLYTLIITCVFFIIASGRKQQLNEVSQYLIIMISVIIAAISLGIILIPGITALEYSLLSLLTYYFAGATLHHYLDRSLNLSIVLEYILIIVLALSIFLSN